MNYENRNYKHYLYSEHPEKFSKDAKKMLYSFKGCRKCGSEDIRRYESEDSSHDECQECGHTFHVIPGGDWEEDTNCNLVCIWKPPQ